MVNVFLCFFFLKELQSRSQFDASGLWKIVWGAVSSSVTPLCFFNLCGTVCCERCLKCFFFCLWVFFVFPPLPAMGLNKYRVRPSCPTICLFVLLFQFCGQAHNSFHPPSVLFLLREIFGLVFFIHRILQAGMFTGNKIKLEKNGRGKEGVD